MPKFNVELAEKVLDHIAHNPMSHYQGSWLNECGTMACIAGHAMLASGEYVRHELEGGTVILREKSTGRAAGPYLDGQRLLGLDDDQARGIFMDMDEDDALGKLRYLVDEARGRHHHHPPFPTTPTIQGENA